MRLVIVRSVPVLVGATRALFCLRLQQKCTLDNDGFTGPQTGDDLDVPGDELDDANEAIGEEDEENNYYSLGGDNKESLEEDASGAEV